MVREGVEPVRDDDGVQAEGEKSHRSPIVLVGVLLRLSAFLGSRTHAEEAVQGTVAGEKFGHLPTLDGDADAHLAQDDRARLARVREIGKDDELAHET